MNQFSISKKTGKNSSSFARPTGKLKERNHKGFGSVPESAVHYPSTMHNLADLEIDQSRPSTVIQPKLKIGKPNDKYEMEADRIAKRVMQMEASSPERENLNQGKSTKQIQRKCAECKKEEKEQIQRQPDDEKEEEMQMKAEPGKTSVGEKVAATLVRPTSGGDPLTFETRNFFESRFGHDFSKVRIHHDRNSSEAARSIHAKAYTLGNNIVFGSGHFNPQNREGQKLLAHELTHVIQQGKSPAKNGIGIPAQSHASSEVLQKKDGPPKKKSNEGIKNAIKAQKLLWDDIHAFSPDSGRKLAGSGYRDSVDYLQTDFTEQKEGGTSTSAPIIYVGKSYFKEKDADKRKEKLKEEIDKIDTWRFDNGRLENDDLNDTKIKNKLQDLPADKKLELIGKLKGRKNGNNDKVVDYLNKVMQSTPEVSGSTPGATGGFELQVDNIKIIVLPDVYNSSEVSTGALTKIDRSDSTTDWGKTPGWKSQGGQITQLDFIPQIPQVEFTIQSHYSSGSKPRYTSGYGVGTRSGDTTSEEKTLGFHEGTHGLEFIKSIKAGLAAHKYPKYPLKVGDPAGGVKQANQTYRQQVTQFRDMIQKALKDNIQKVDCVGKTIEQYHKENHTHTDVHCNP